MVRQAQLKPNQVVLDPFCGAGTILAEAFFLCKRKSKGNLEFWNPTFVGSPGQKNRPVLWKLTRSVPVTFVVFPMARSSR